MHIVMYVSLHLHLLSTRLSVERKILTKVSTCLARYSWLLFIFAATLSTAFVESKRDAVFFTMSPHLFSDFNARALPTLLKADTT